MVLMIDSTASPEAVLAAVKADASDWRDPRVPELMRGLGLLRVDASVTGKRFAMNCLCDQRTPRRPYLAGTVEHRPNGASRVVAEVKMQPSYGWLITLLVACTILWWGGHPGLAGWIAGLATLGTVAMEKLPRSRGEMDANPFAAHLVERLRAAVAAAEGTDGDASVGAA